MKQIIIMMSQFFSDHWPQIIWILLLFLFGKVFLRRLVKRMVSLAVNRAHEKGKRKMQMEKQAKTAGQIIMTTGNVVIYTILLFMILALFDVNLGPILTGAGIIGLAVGFGSQTLVKDFVSGVFIILEQQYGIGDEVKIGDIEGKVLRMTMRSTVLEDAEKRRIYLTNGTITKVINKSQSSEDE